MAKFQQEADRVIEIVKLHRGFSEFGVAAIEIMRVGHRQAVIEAFREQDGAIPIQIRAAMLERLLHTVSRMLDKPGTDRDSLRRVFDLLAKPEVHAEVARLGHDESLIAAERRWHQLNRSKALSRLRRLRDYMAAHTISSKWDSVNPKMGDLHRTARSLFQILEDLALGVGLKTTSMDTAKKVWRSRARDFWTRVVAGSRALKRDQKSRPSIKKTRKA